MRNLLDMVAPAGMAHSGSGYLSLIRKGWAQPLKFVRVTGSGAAAATCTIEKTGPVDCLTLALKYVGNNGNSVNATISAASDGDANHFNLTVSVVGASGTTTDLVQNLNYSGINADSTPDLTRCLLLGSITKVAAGVPLSGTTAFTGGSDGSITSGEYVGTAGTANKGVALFEADRTIDYLFADDCGGSLRSAVNAGLQAHADLMTDRVAFINGPSGQSAATARTDVANYRSLRAGYVDAWAYILDDVDGTKRLVPSASFAASVAAQLPPSTSIAWKSDVVQKMLAGIVDLEFDRGDGAAANTDAGIITLMRERAGGFTFEAAPNTDMPVNPDKGQLNRTRMGHYIARSIVDSLRTNTDAPNVAAIQQDEIVAVDTFLGQLKKNATTDPLGLPHIINYAIKDVKTSNAQSDLDNGEFTIDCDIKTSSAQSKIFIGMNFGESTQVSVQL